MYHTRSQCAADAVLISEKGKSVMIRVACSRWLTRYFWQSLSTFYFFNQNSEMVKTKSYCWGTDIRQSVRVKFCLVNAHSWLLKFSSTFTQLTYFLLITYKSYHTNQVEIVNTVTQFTTSLKYLAFYASMYVYAYEKSYRRKKLKWYNFAFFQT